MKNILYTAQSKLTQLKETLAKSIHNIDLNQWDTSETLIKALESSKWLLGEWVDTHSIKSAYSLGRLLETNPRVAKIVVPEIMQDRTLTEAEINAFLEEEHDYFIEDCLINEKAMLNQAQSTLTEITEVYQQLTVRLTQINSLNETLSQVGQSSESPTPSYSDIKKDIETIIDHLTTVKRKLILNKKKDYQLHQNLLKRCKTSLLQIEKESVRCITNCLQFIELENSRIQKQSGALKTLQARINQRLFIQPELMPSISNHAAYHTWMTNLSGCESSPWDYKKTEWHIKKLRLLRMLETDATARLKQPKTLNYRPGNHLEDLFCLYYQELVDHAGHESLYITQNDLNILAMISPKDWESGRQLGCHAIHILALCGSPLTLHQTNYCRLMERLFSQYKQNLIMLPVSKTIPSSYPSSWSTINFVILSFIMNHKPEHSNHNLEQQYPGLTSLLKIIKMNIIYKQFIELIGPNDFKQMISQNDPARYEPTRFNVIRQLIDYASGCLCLYKKSLELLRHNETPPKNHKVYIPPDSFYTELPELLFATEFNQSNLKVALVEARVKTRRMTRSINFEMANSDRVKLFTSQSPSPTSVTHIRSITNTAGAITPTPSLPPKKRGGETMLMQWNQAAKKSSGANTSNFQLTNDKNKKPRLNPGHDHLTVQTHFLL